MDHDHHHGRGGSNSPAPRISTRIPLGSARGTGSEDGPRPWKGPGSLPVAPFSLSPVKIIWQCYSELCPLAKNTLPAPLEVKVFCPYLCTTPQGRDGRRATDIREGKRGAGRCTARSADHRKRASKKYFKKDFAVSKKVPTFAVPTKGNSDGRDVRSGKK